MTEFLSLPRLEIGDANSPFDEAVIWIEGREEETIRIECEGAGRLAALLVRLVNEYRRDCGLQPPDQAQSPYRAGPGIAGEVGELS